MHIGVNITAFGQEIPFSRAIPLFSSNVPVFGVFRIGRAMNLFVPFCVLPVWNLKVHLHGHRLSPG